MTVIVQVPSQEYSPRTVNVNPPIPAGTKQLKLTLSRESWPVGPCIDLRIKFPDGSDAAGVTIDGGVQTFTPPFGSPHVVTTSGVTINGLRDDQGVLQDLPAGNYGVSVQVLQTLTTSILAERF